MTAIRVNNYLTIVSDHVFGWYWDHRHYVNGSESYLIVRMANGTEYRVAHEPHCGTDAYRVEKELQAALDGKKLDKWP